MKNFFLTVITLFLISALNGCDGDNKTDCKSDPKAKGCPLYDGNITDSSPKSWDMSKDENKPSKEDK